MSLQRLVREVRAWSKLHHRNVLNLLGFTYGFDVSSTLASLVSPWMPKGTSTRYLEKRSAAERIRVVSMPLQRSYMGSDFFCSSPV